MRRRGGWGGGKASPEDLEKIRPAIERFDANRPSEAFVGKHTRNPTYKHHNFFHIYDNYFREPNSSISPSEHAGLQRERYSIISETLQIIQNNANDPTYYGNNKTVEYFKLAKKIQDDLKSDHELKQYNKNRSFTKLNRAKL